MNYGKTVVFWGEFPITISNLDDEENEISSGVSIQAYEPDQEIPLRPDFTKCIWIDKDTLKDFIAALQEFVE